MASNHERDDHHKHLAAEKWGSCTSVNEKKMKGAACEEAQQSVATNKAPICAAEAFAAHTTFGHYAEVSN